MVEGWYDVQMMDLDLATAMEMADMEASLLLLAPCSEE